ncbi:M35 family metallo-endopeptidase [Collimonas silvisoli]|uniref:M35 family metallo-endopeptidase n=1 Tax=Collimonas silvisoli TaxID=2825884 RepID=UPI001B8C94F8|nr:M35 family metallo-endopeptidase [Collimonas silvisoli]
MTVTYPDGTPLKKIAAKNTTLASDTSEKIIYANFEAICPNMTNGEFARTVMRLRDEAVVRTTTRINQLARWDASDKEAVIQWFGADSDDFRSKLLTGLKQMNRVFSELTPSNFVRWSETALSYLNCDGSKVNPSTTAAVVCKPDVATHMIAITLKFCELPDERKNFDTGKAYDGDSRLLTLVHEVSHFNDTMGSNDEWYTTWKSKRRAEAKDRLCITNAESIGAYIVWAKGGDK